MMPDLSREQRFLLVSAGVGGVVFDLMLFVPGIVLSAILGVVTSVVLYKFLDGAGEQ